MEVIIILAYVFAAGAGINIFLDVLLAYVNHKNGTEPFEGVDIWSIFMVIIFILSIIVINGQ